MFCVVINKIGRHDVPERPVSKTVGQGREVFHPGSDDLIPFPFPLLAAMIQDPVLRPEQRHKT